MEEKKKYIINCELTRAEYLLKSQQKELGTKDGLVIKEYSLHEDDLRKEFNEILEALKRSDEEGFHKYTLFMIKSVSYAMKQGKIQNVIRELKATTDNTDSNKSTV